MDDILIYSEKAQDHEDNVKWVLQKLREANLFVNVQKCKFDTDEVRFLGYIVSAKGIRMETDRIEAIRSWPEPRSIRDIQVFIGFANFYRRFIQRFSKKTAALTSLIINPSKKRVKKSLASAIDFLTEEARRSFNLVKNAFTEAPILQHFNHTLPARVETDASGGAIGGILTQQDSQGRWHPCAYYSRKIQPAERNYETHDGKLLAIVEAFRQWRHYLQYSPHEILVLTDHNNLRRFMDVKKLSGRQIRWAQELSTYNFRIDYKAGTRNPANGLSQRPDFLEEDNDAIEANKRCLYGLQQSLQKGLGFDTPLTPSAEQQNSDHETRCAYVRRSLTLVHKSLKDFWSDTQLMPSVEHFNRCIFVAGTLMLRITPNVYARAMQTCGTASKVASDEDTAAVVGPSLVNQISDAFLGDSVALAIRKGLETQVGSSASFLPWSEGDNGLLLHHNQIYVPEALHSTVIT